MLETGSSEVFVVVLGLVVVVGGSVVVAVVDIGWPD